MQILFGHTKIETAVRYLSIDMEDALQLVEKTEIYSRCTRRWD